jgi:hypothetical protein
MITFYDPTMTNKFTVFYFEKNFSIIIRLANSRFLSTINKNKNSFVSLP